MLRQRTADIDTRSTKAFNIERFLVTSASDITSDIALPRILVATDIHLRRMSYEMDLSDICSLLCRSKTDAV